MGTLSKLRRLVLREGVSVREAAQRVGIARNTASRWLALGDMVEPRYRRRVPSTSILEPYKEQLVLWLKADVLKQVIKVGDSGALVPRRRGQRAVEQSR